MPRVKAADYSDRDDVYIAKVKEAALRDHGPDIAALIERYIDGEEFEPQREFKKPRHKLQLVKSSER